MSAIAGIKLFDDRFNLLELNAFKRTYLLKEKNLYRSMSSVQWKIYILSKVATSLLIKYIE